MEHAALLLVAGVMIIVAVSYFAPKLGVAAPVLLVLVGIGCSVLPWTPTIVVEPEWILMVVLPPILYSAAVNVPIIDLRRDFGTISALSVVLVIVSAFGAGLLIWWLLPGIGLPAAIALGAVISPPDAVAATSVGKRLGLPPRLVTILEGEGLINDATALVLMRTAVVAIAGAFSFWGALGDFALAVVVGVLVGAAVGLVSVWVRSRIRQPVLTTAISLVVPFVAYIPAEELHASGVLSVVVTGLITGHQSAKHFSAQDRISERTNWRTIQLLLENGVFLLMGFEITGIMAEVDEKGQGAWASVWIGLLATVGLVVIRVLFVVPVIASLRKQQLRASERTERIDSALDTLQSQDFHPELEQRAARKTKYLQRRHADATFLANEGLGWRGGAVLAWSGMRGVVTLAAAQSLPADLPLRDEMVLIAFTVAIVTLVVQGGTLPLLINLLGVEGTDVEKTRQEQARLANEISAAADALLDNPSLRQENGKPFDPEVIERVRRRRLAVSQAMDAIQKSANVHGPLQQQRELQRLLIEAEQNALLDARASGTCSSGTLEKAQEFIDNEVVRLERTT